MSYSIREVGLCKMNMLGLLPLDGNIIQRKINKGLFSKACQVWVVKLFSQNNIRLRCMFPSVYVLTLRTQSGIVWVLGERWWVLMTMTVIMMEAMTKTIVKSMYFPMSGTALEVEGISSTMTSRNTVRDNRTEMLRVIFSPGRHRRHLLWSSRVSSWTLQDFRNHR